MRLPRALIYLLALAPICIHFLLLGKYGENIPIYDDFDVFLKFLSSYYAAPDAMQKLLLLFSQHNEHRILFNRLFALFFSWTGNPVDLRGVLFLGNAFLALHLPVLYAMSSEKKDFSATTRLASFLPVVFLLFLPVNWNCSFWPTTAVQYYAVDLFSLLTIYLLARRVPAPGLAFLCACLALFSSGGGVIAPVLGALTLWMRRERKAALLFLLGSLVAIGVFFLGYARPESPSSARGLSLAFLKDALGYFLTFLRSAIPSKILPVNALGLAAGLCLALFFALLAVLRYDRKNLAVFMGIVYIMANAAAVSLARASLGAEHGMAERYAIYSLLLLGLYYLALLDILPSKFESRAVKAGLALSLLLYATMGPFILTRMEKHRAWTKNSLCEWSVNHTGLLYPDQSIASSILENSIKQRLYAPPLHLCDK